MGSGFKRFVVLAHVQLALKGTGGGGGLLGSAYLFSDALITVPIAFVFNCALLTEIFFSAIDCETTFRVSRL